MRAFHTADSQEPTVGKQGYIKIYHIPDRTITPKLHRKVTVYYKVEPIDSGASVHTQTSALEL